MNKINKLHSIKSLFAALIPEFTDYVLYFLSRGREGKGIVHECYYFYYICLKEKDFQVDYLISVYAFQSS